MARNKTFGRSHTAGTGHRNKVPAARPITNRGHSHTAVVRVPKQSQLPKAHPDAPEACLRASISRCVIARLCSLRELLHELMSAHPHGAAGRPEAGTEPVEPVEPAVRKAGAARPPRPKEQKAKTEVEPHTLPQTHRAGC